MDSITKITAYGPHDVASSAIQAAFASMHRLDATASFHSPTSALSRLNSQREIIPDPLLSAIFSAASEAAALSGGRFDPTFAVLHRSYGFYDGHGRLPPQAELASDLALIGWGRVMKQDPGSSGTYFLASGSLVDLAGIAGGFAVRMAADAMRAASCPAFFIDDGGDLWMEGRKPDGRPWRVAVKDPRSDTRPMAIIETFEPLAISTSGDYERFIEVDGKRYGHIMDLSTGRPAALYRSVTVLASDPISTEIFSKTLFTLPPEEALRFADQHSIAALFLPATGTTWLTTAGKSQFTEVVQ
ncbi:MAG: FAD:protein FMN transferase [Candidatus Ozemobacteraceae bacterium]